MGRKFRKAGWAVATLFASQSATAAVACVAMSRCPLDEYARHLPQLTYLSVACATFGFLVTVRGAWRFLSLWHMVLAAVLIGVTNVLAERYLKSPFLWVGANCTCDLDKFFPLWPSNALNLAAAILSACFSAYPIWQLSRR
jgi:hypothetical protein